MARVRSYEAKPHLVTLTIEHGALSLSAACPYVEMGSARPCALLDENPESPPEEPAAPDAWVEGRPARQLGDRLVLLGAKDPWTVWQKTVDEWTAWIPTDACWVEHFLAEYDYDPYDVMTGTLTFSAPMDYDNTGGVEDAFLALSPWPPA